MEMSTKLPGLYRKAPPTQPQEHKPRKHKSRKRKRIMRKTARDTATDVADFGMADQHSADRQAWEVLISGPKDADRSVLLLPGGANAARSYDLVMADPALSGVRLVATTLPGMAGAPLTGDISIPGLARTAGELAKEHRCDVVAGSSHGATGRTGEGSVRELPRPAVLRTQPDDQDDAAFFVRTVRLSQKVGRWPLGLLMWLLPLMIRSAKIPEPHKRELIEDLKQNKAGEAVRVSAKYLDYIAADRDYAAHLAASSIPAWVVHAEKGGDGGLTDAERATLESADNVTLVTVPGSVFLLPDEAPDQTAAVIATALSTLD